MAKLTHARETGFLGDELNEQRLVEEFCDVILSVGERQFHAHRCVLVVNSPYFRGMFSNALLESGKKPIPMDESVKEEEVLEMLMDYFYTGEITINSANAQSLLTAADLLLLPELKADCCKFLKWNIAPSNCLGIWMLADHHSCDDLRQVAFQFALNNFGKVAKQSEFLDLSLADVLKLLMSDHLTAKSEATVFSAAMRWIRHDEANRKAFLTEILGGVRLTLCTEKFLAQTIGKDRLIQSSEECRHAIAKAIKTKNQQQPPKKKAKNQSSLLPLDQPRTPAPRRQTLCIVEGSRDSGANVVEKTEALVAHGQALMVISAVIPQRTVFAMATLADRIFVFGGMNKSVDHLTTMDCYNASSNQWTSLAPMTTGRNQHCAAVLDGQIYAIGGVSDDPDDDDMVVLATDSVERYDPASDSWQAVTPMNTGRSEFAAVALDDAIYVLGGESDDGHVISVERFDLSTGRWTFVTPMTAPREHFGCAVFQGKIVIAGGVRDRDDCDHPLASVECFDPVTEQWTDKGDLIEARYELSLAVVDGRLLAVGGACGEMDLVDSVEEYVPETDSWRFLCNLEVTTAGNCVGVVWTVSAD